MVQLDILRYSDSWKAHGGLAIAPILLATILPLLARIAPEFLVPSLFPVGLVYNVDELVLLVILLVGAALGIRKGIPWWSYSWVVLSVTGIMEIIAALSANLLLANLDPQPFTAGWLQFLTFLFGSLLVMLFAASRARVAPVHSFFVAAIYLASSSVRPFIHDVSDIFPLDKVIMVNAASLFIASIELVAAVMHFLTGDSNVQRRSVYVLTAVVFLDPVLTGWIFALRLLESTFFDVLGFWGLQVLVRWVVASVTLIITGALTFLFLRLGRSNVTTPTPRGEAHAG